MAQASDIEWTDATWNPVAGCDPCSPGCKNCYAARMARRLEAMGQAKYAGTAERRGSVDVFTGVINLDESALPIPLKWRKPRRVFVNSMSDLFHDDVPFEFIRRVWRVMVTARQHTFQVLTKRPERMAHFLEHESEVPAMTGLKYGVGWLPKNIWLGTSVEDQKRADERIPALLECPAAVRFLSCEPLLGPVDLSDAFGTCYHDATDGDTFTGDAPYNHGLHWVIVGGESGPKCRPCDPLWVRSVVRQCREAEVPVFVKQMGGNIVTRNDMVEDTFNSCETGWPDPCVEHDINGVREDYQGADCRIHLRDKKGGDINEFPADLRIREFPVSPAPSEAAR